MKDLYLLLALLLVFLLGFFAMVFLDRFLQNLRKAAKRRKKHRTYLRLDPHLTREDARQKIKEFKKIYSYWPTVIYDSEEINHSGDDSINAPHKR